MIKRLQQHFHSKRRGQSLVEFALVLPLLILLILTMVEFGFMMNYYLALLDSTRNAARFSSDSDYKTRDALTNCTTTHDFFMQSACVVRQELNQEKPTITFSVANGDDIVVSAVSIWGDPVSGPVVTARNPSNAGWSYAEALTGTRNHASTFTNAQIQSLLQSPTPNTGFVIVELFHNYNQMLGLPWILPFLPNPIPFQSRAVMPLVSAEPTPTPIP